MSIKGYHVSKINKGIFGEVSKIQEEFEEFMDGVEQDNKLLILCELSDLIGAVEGYLENNFETISLDDLIKMSKLTKKAFKDGVRV